MSINSIVMWETQHNKCRLGLFQDSDFAGDLEDSTSTSGGQLCIFWKSNIRADKLELKSFCTLRIFVFLNGLMTWLVKPRNVWNDTVY